jgi:hypothetical protein
MMQTQVTIGAWPDQKDMMPVVTEQEKSDKNTDKSGPYDDKRNIIACEEAYRLKVNVKLLQATNTVTKEADDLETDDYSVCRRTLLTHKGTMTNPGLQ